MKSKITWPGIVAVSMGFGFAFAIKKVVEKKIEEKRIGNVLFQTQIGYISI